MDRRSFLRGIPAAGAAVAISEQSVAFALEPTGKVAALIQDHRTALATWQAAKAAGVEMEEAIRTERHRRRPMSVMPGIGAADICVMIRRDVERAYNGAMLTVFARRGVDGDALMAEALRNYDAAWKAEEERADQMGRYAGVRAEHKAGEAVMTALLVVCAYHPTDEGEAAQRRAYLVPLLMNRGWAWGLGTVAEWTSVYAAALGGEAGQ